MKEAGSGWSCKVANMQSPPSGETMVIPPGAPGCVREDMRAEARCAGRVVCMKYIPHPLPKRSPSFPKCLNCDDTWAEAATLVLRPVTFMWWWSPAMKEASRASVDWVLYGVPMVGCWAVREKVSVAVAGGGGSVDGGACWVEDGCSCWM